MRDETSLSNTVERQARWRSLPQLAEELVRLKVDLIVVRATPVVQAAKNATTTIPIVMMGVGDPVRSGFVASLAHPGGNITGMSNMMPELAGKRLDLLREIRPKISRLAFLAYSPDPLHKVFVKDAQEVAERFKNPASASGHRQG